MIIRIIGCVGMGDAGTGVDSIFGVDVGGEIVKVAIGIGVTAGVQAVNTPARNTLSSAFFISFPFIY